MHQAVDAFFDFDESAEFGHVADAAFHHRTDAVALLDRGPRIGSNCFSPSEMRRSLRLTSSTTDSTVSPGLTTLDGASCAATRSFR